MYTKKGKNPSRKVKEFVLSRPLVKQAKLLTKTTVSESRIKAVPSLNLRINTEETLQQVYVRRNFDFLSKRRVESH
jgi:hypothetical protein